MLRPASRRRATVARRKPSVDRSRRRGISQAGRESRPGVGRRVPGNARDHWPVKLLCQVICSRSGELATDHVLNDPHDTGSLLDGSSHGAADGIAGLWRGNRHRQHGRRLAEDVAQLDVALHPGRQIEQKRIEAAPIHIAQEFAECGGFHRSPPDEALGARALEGEGGAVLEQESHGDAFHSVEAGCRLYAIVRRAVCRAWGLQEAWYRRAVQVSVQDANLLPRACKRARKVGCDITLPHAPLAAHHRDCAPHAGQPIGYAPALREDLVQQAGAVGIGQLMVGAHGLKTSRGGGWSVSIPYDRSAQAKAPIRSGTPESRNLFRLAERNREGACAWRPARELRIQGRARTPAICAGAGASPAAAALETLRCTGAGYPA